MKNAIATLLSSGKPVALLLDYGGTIDTNGRHWAGVLWEAYQAVGVPISEEQFRDAYVFGERALAKAPIVKPQDNFKQMLLKKVEQELAWLEFKKEVNFSGLQSQSYIYDVANYCDRFVQQTLEKARPVLKKLAAKFPIVLVSNFYGNLHSVLTAYELDGLFKEVVESSVEGVRKPDPKLFRLAAQRAGVPAAQTILVGDSFGKDIRPARSIGCRTVWLKGTAWKQEEVDETLPDAVITDFAELEGLLL